jgi:hypothetical protein
LRMAFALWNSIAFFTVKIALTSHKRHRDESVDNN